MTVNKVERIDYPVIHSPGFSYVWDPVIRTETLLQIGSDPIPLSDPPRERILQFLRALAPEYVGVQSQYWSPAMYGCYNLGFEMCTFFLEQKMYSKSEIRFFGEQIDSSQARKLHGCFDDPAQEKLRKKQLPFSALGIEAGSNEDGDIWMKLVTDSFLFELQKPFSILLDAEVGFYEKEDLVNGRISRFFPASPLNFGAKGDYASGERLLAALIQRESDPFQSEKRLPFEHGFLSVFNPTMERVFRAGQLYQELCGYVKEHTPQFKLASLNMGCINTCNNHLRTKGYSGNLFKALEDEKEEIRKILSDLPPFPHAEELSDLI